MGRAPRRANQRRRVSAANQVDEANLIAASRPIRLGVNTSSHELEDGDAEGLLASLWRLQVREQRSSGEEVQIILGYEAV
jgi:hypothetical protein